MTDRLKLLVPWALLLALTVSAARFADPVAVKIQGPDTTGTPVPVQTVPASAPGSAAVQLTASNSAPAGTATASLTAAVGKTNYVTAVQLTSSGTTAASTLTYTLSGIQGGSLVWIEQIIAQPGQNGYTQQITFSPPLAASATNTAITIATSAQAAGGNVNTVSIWGYQQ